jgi:replicative DNA helicase
VSDREQRRQVADQAEQGVIGSLMIDQSPDRYDRFVRVVGIAPPETFYRPTNATIMRTLVDQFTADLPVDPVSIAARLADAGELARIGGAGYLHACMEGAIPAQALHHAGVVARDARRRGNAEQAARLAQLAAEGDLDKIAAFQRDLVEQWTAAEAGSEADPAMVDGGSFIFDAPAVPPAVWGKDEMVLWAQGEALMLCGPAGVGKTTIFAQLVAARLGLLDAVLGMPVRRTERRVLYLAMDRPPQISRAMRRLFTPEQRDYIEQHLIVRKGPPPADFAKHPDTLVRLTAQAGADTVFVDSIKDAAIGLSADEAGAGYNNARQRALAAGVEVAEAHHQRKASSDNKRPDKLADVYGSTWLTAGAGSVLMLWGEPGDPIVDLSHLKQPMEPFGPLILAHDHATGHTSIHHQADLLLLTRYQGKVGMNARLAAQQLFSTDAPTAAELQKARRRLATLVRQGHLIMKEGSGQESATYFLAAQDIDRLAPRMTPRS